MKPFYTTIALLLFSVAFAFSQSANHAFSFGSRGAADGQFFFPSGIAVDNSGNIYVADRGLRRIQVFDNDGNHQLSFGSQGTANGQFSNPYGIAVDKSGNIYVADGVLHRIQVFDNAGNHLRSFGSEGSADGQFNTPLGVAVDNNGKIYVADVLNSRIQVFDNDGNHLLSFGSPVRTPWGVAVDESGNIYVANRGNNRIQVFDNDGNHQLTFGGQGSADGQFSLVAGIAVDKSGNIYVADRGTSRIQVFDNAGNHLLSFGSSGSADGQFSSPIGVAVDNSGNIYVADTNNDRIQVFESEGLLPTCDCDPSCSPLPEAAGTYVATTSNTDENGVNHYCDAAGNLLLSVKVPAGGTIPVSAVSLKIGDPLVSFQDQYCGNPAASGCFVLNPLGAPILNRQWHIDGSMVTGIAPFTSMNVTYYFTQAEFMAVQSAATDNSSTALSNDTDMQLYKVNDWLNAFGPFPLPSSIMPWYNAMSIKNGATPGILNWTKGAYDGPTGGTAADFLINNFSGGGGAGGVIQN